MDKGISASFARTLERVISVCSHYDGIRLIIENNVETVVLLSGEKVDGHIDIDLDVEKLEGKSGIATYTEIKAYIKGKYGFNVTSLYIGQI